MQIIFEAHLGMARRDFSDEAQARQAVETRGSGSVVTYVRHEVFPCGHKDSSCAISVYEDGKWRGIDISGY